MALSINRTTVSGRVCFTPELKTSPSGISYSKNSIAWNKPKKSKEDKDEVEFYKVTFGERPQKTSAVSPRRVALFMSKELCITKHMRRTASRLIRCR